MKKSILLTIVALIGVALFAASAGAVVVTNTTTWGMNCDLASAQTTGTITIKQSFPAEFSTALGASGLIRVTYATASIERGVAGLSHTALLTSVGSTTSWTVATLQTGWAAPVLTIGDTTNPLGADGFDNAAAAALTTSEGFTIPGASIITGDGLSGNSTGNANCTSTKCLITGMVYVGYTNLAGGALHNCKVTQTVLLATSDAQPDLCHTTLKFPYLVNYNDTNGAYITALIVTSNLSTTCVDNAFDTVDFYAWDEGANYRGHRGPYILRPDGQVTIVVSDPDDGSANDIGVTADAIKHTSYQNTWWDLSAGTWNSWLNADGQVTGRGQVIALVNQNHAEGYQFLFHLGDAGVLGFGTSLAIKDLTNYVGTEDEQDYVGAYVRSVLMLATTAFDSTVAVATSGVDVTWNTVDDTAAIGTGMSAPGWASSTRIGGYSSGSGAAGGYNMGIVSVTALGKKTRSIAGITDGYVH